MIEEIQIENLRLFDQRAWNFELGDLTIFCGTNSSGKTTLLKTLLLMKQTQVSTVKEGVLQLISSGDYANFGDFSSLISRNSFRKNLKVGVTTSGLISKDDIKFYQKFSDNKSKISKIDSFTSKFPKQEVLPCSLIGTFTFGLPKNYKEHLRKSSSDAILKYSSFKIRVGSEDLFEWKISLCSPEMGLEGHYTLEIPNSYFQANFVKELDTESKFDSNEAIKVPVYMQGLLPLMIAASHADNKDKPTKKSKKTSWSGRMIPPELLILTMQFSKALDNLHTLGPLRAPARRYYIQENQLPLIDTTGTTIPYVLRDNASAKVKYIRPGLNKGPVESTLEKAVSDWLHYFRTGDPELPTCEEYVIQSAEPLVSVLVRNPSGIQNYPLVDSGFGYSQLLPIIVKALMIENNETIIVEQPELHLNPALQVRMAEFLASLSMNKRQVILETHSEHLVNTIRALTAEKVLNPETMQCKIYYLDVRDDLPVVNELTIKDDGSLNQWPSEFFGEALKLSGRIMRAQKKHK